MEKYLDIVKHVLKHGERKETRTGIDTISTFNYNYEIDLASGFPLLTTKKINWKNIVIELLWFLSGDKTLDFLHKHNCKFWDSWSYDKTFVEAPYGDYWRKFPVQQSCHPCVNNSPYGKVDQINFIIKELKRNPDSRRLVVSSWYPQKGINDHLVPCHCMFIFNVQYENGEPKLCLHLTQRSCDVALGVPYNIASYSLLLLLVSHLTGIKPGIFAHTLVDAHIYTSKPDGSQSEYNHIPGLNEQLGRNPYSPPTVNISNVIQNLEDIDEIINDCSTEKILSMFKLNNYQSWEPIHFKVAV